MNIEEFRTYCLFIKICVSVIDHRLCSCTSKQISCSNAAFSGSENENFFSF